MQKENGEGLEKRTDIMKKKEEGIETTKIEEMIKADENQKEGEETQRGEVETGHKLQVCALETNHSHPT